MRGLMNPAAVVRPVKKEPIVMDLDDEDVLYGEAEQESMMDVDQVDNLTDSGELNPSKMPQIVSAAAAADGDDWDTKIDHQYSMLLDSFRGDENSYLSENPLRSIRYEVDNGGYDKREFKDRRSREDRNSICVTKKNVEPKPHVQASTKKTTKEADFELRQRESLMTEKTVEASHVTRNSQHDVNACEKENSENPMVLDECYKSYLIWLVANSKSPRTNNPEKEIQVKCEEDIMSLSDSDSGTIVVEDRPFLDGEDSPFVPSKSDKVTDLHEESSDQGSSWCRKEVMNILKQPGTEKELKELHNEASECRFLTRCWELRDGRELSYTTKLKTPSHLDRHPDFKRKYIESLRERDPHKALNLLRGFKFYLTVSNVVRDGAFKPWLDHECLKITCSDKRVSTL